VSTLGAQEAIVTAAPGEWELIGRDMIRTKRTADGGGMIVAQFWTSPAPEHAALMVAAPGLVAELKAAVGYMRNARIDLETGATKATAIRTIDGGIKRAEAALAKAGA